MTDHPNAARYREMMKLMESGGFDAVLEGIAPDVEWWEMGATEPIRGRDAVAERMNSMLGDLEWHVDLHDVLANDSHLVALLHVDVSRNGEKIEYNVAEISHINSAGQMTERWAFSDDTEKVLDFFD